MRHAIAGFLAGFSCLCLAQDDAVVITAPRFPEDVRRLPASVTVLSEEDIAKSAARTLPELLAGEAGLTMKDFYGNNAAVTSVDLRGFGITGPQNTLILLDGRRLNDFDLSGVQWSAVPIASIERIEILRGMGAVLYGDSASAGVVNIVTRSPLRRGKDLEAFGRAGSYDTLEGQLYASAAGERLGVNGSVYGYASDGYRANNRNEQQNNTLNLRWAVGNGALDLRFGTDRQDIRLPGGRFVQPSIGLDEYATDPRGTNTPLDHASRDGKRAGLSLLQRVGDAELLAGLDFRGKEQFSYFDQGGFPATREDKLDLVSLTPRLRVPFATAAVSHRLTAGADWHSWRYRSLRADRPENLGRPANRVAVDQDTFGWYLQDTLELTRATLLTVGWREERAKYSGNDVADPASPACAFCTEAPAFSETQKQRAWELGLRHALDARWALFSRAGRSFRFVNAEEVYENDAFFNAQFQLLRPQTARSNEIGAEWRRGTDAARATLFRNEVTDEIHLDPFTTGVGNTNLPPSRREGIELDGRWQASQTLRVSAGYAYTKAEFIEGTLAGSPFAIGTNMPIAGKTVPLVPRHKLNLGAIWDLAPRTSLSGLLTAVSEQVLDNDEPNTLAHRIPAYYLVDLKLAQRFSWGRLAAAVNNVFDENYYTYAVRSAFMPDRFAVYPLPGRTLSLSAEIRF
jgi:iron complex outermembrane recepter protein